ncbi:MAG: TonB C-terminal domain-containing protein [Verrucomicrobiales bacterium]|jgi:TonB family protein|nr:TonB C-terminal domain-containing protein [Verrucomicrobiales bacterium]
MTDARKISKKTLLWVSAAHALVLLLAVFFARLMAPTPPPKMLEMIGLPDSLNPADGEPGVQPRAPEIPNAPSPAPSAAPPPPMTPPQPLPVTPSPSAPQNHFPVEPPAPKPPPPKPRTPVKPNLTRTIRDTANSAADSQRHPNSGLNVNSVAESLRRGVSGVSNRADGPSGSPTGNPNGDWYRTLIKNTLERHWIKPPLNNPTLTTTVKIRVLANGAIEYLGLTASSGDAAMDNSVVSAVRAAGKVSSPPPAGFKIPYEDTVIFKFKND